MSKHNHRSDAVRAFHRARYRLREPQGTEIALPRMPEGCGALIGDPSTLVRPGLRPGTVRPRGGSVSEWEALSRCLQAVTAGPGNGEGELMI